MSRAVRAACLDKGPSDSKALQQHIEALCLEHRNAIGHQLPVSCYPTTRAELLLNSAPDVFLIGSRFSPDEAYAVCRELATLYPATAVILFLEQRWYSLRTLRHFESFCFRVFPEKEDSIAVLHTLLQLGRRKVSRSKGALVAVMGVKGGVGATTCAVGLADAAQRAGIETIMLDLSAGAVVPFYLAAKRWESPEFAAALRANSTFEPELLERCIEKTAGGLSLLLQPAGGSEIRELFLRSKETLDYLLELMDLLTRRYELVLVDLGGAEGIFPFTLRCSADSTVLVSSNEAASVHLLGHVLTDVLGSPGESKLQLLVTELRARGLQYQDIIDFLACYPGFSEEMLPEETVPYDSRGRNWIGSGQTFYQEAGRATRKVLERYALQRLVPSTSGQDNAPHRSSQTLLTRLFSKRVIRKRTAPKALPAPESDRPLLGLSSFYEPPRVCQGEKNYETNGII